MATNPPNPGGGPAGGPGGPSGPGRRSRRPVVDFGAARQRVKSGAAELNRRAHDGAEQLAPHIIAGVDGAADDLWKFGKFVGADVAGTFRDHVEFFAAASVESRQEAWQHNNSVLTPWGMVASNREWGRRAVRRQHRRDALEVYGQAIGKAVNEKQGRQWVDALQTWSPPPVEPNRWRRVGRTVDAVMAGVNAAVDVGAERVARRADNHVAGLVGEVKHVFTGRGSRTPTAERPNVSVLDDTLDRQGLPPLVDEHSGEPLHYNNLTDKQLDSYLKRTYATVLRNGATERPVDRVASFTQFTRHGALVAAKAEAERHVNIYLRDGKWEDGFNPSADKLLRKSVLSRLKYMEQRAEKKFGKVINAANRQLHDQNLHVRPDMLFLKETAEELKRMATHDLQRQIVALEGGGWIPEPRRGSYRDRWTNRGQNAGSLSSPEDYKQAIGPRYGELQNFRIQGRAPDSAMADRWFEQAWKLWEADQARERAFKAGEIDEATNDRLGRQLASGIDSASEQGSSYLTDAERADWQTDGFLEQQRQSGEVVKSLVDRSQWTLRDFLQQVSLHEVSLMGRGPNAATQVAQLRDVKFVTPDNLSATPGSINDMIRSVNSRVHTVVPQNLYAPRPAHPNPDQLLVQDLERLGNVMGEAMKMASDRGWSPAIQGGANGWRPGTVVMDGIQVDDATGRRIGAAFEAVRRHAARIDDAVPSPGVPSDRDDFLAQVGRLEAYMDSVLTPHDPNHYVARGSGAIPPRAPMNVGAIAHTPSPSGASL